MITGIDLQATQDFIIEGDDDNPTTWKLGAMPSYAIGQISSKMGDDYMTGMFKTVQMGLRGWTNFQVNGKDVEFKTEKINMYGVDTDAIPDTLLNMIPVTAVMAIASELLDINKLSETEAKN